jgi:hypothetical protein
MKTMKQTLAPLALAFSLTATLLTPVHEARAGIIIGAAIPGIGSALIGLTITGAGFFWGIQSEGLNPWAAALFVLDQEPKPAGIADLLVKKYPGLDPVLADELGRIISRKISNEAQAGAGTGAREILMTESEMRPVLEILRETGSDLHDRLLQDLTLSTFH